jgi:iron complex transport system substrate-binding protein
MRIASLIPSGTDLVVALGLGDSLVGVSHECDHPQAAGLPVLTSSIIPPPTTDGPSIAPGEIDRLVSSSIQDGNSLYLTDRDLLRELAPDVIVTQDVCDVCAVSADAAKELVCELSPGAQLVMLTATTTDGFLNDLRVLGEALGAQATAAEVERSTQAALDAQRALPSTGRRMLALEWSDPPFLGGHWVPELVELAGSQHVISSSGEASRRATWDEIAAADPDVIVFCPCGYDLHQSSVEASKLLRDPAVAALRAVREGRFYAVDANRLFSRCTTNLVEACELLRALGTLPADAAAPQGSKRITAS